MVPDFSSRLSERENTMKQQHMSREEFYNYLVQSILLLGGAIALILPGFAGLPAESMATKVTQWGGIFCIICGVGYALTPFIVKKGG